MPVVEGNAAVTDPRAADERLREAFQALGDASHRELSPDEVDRVWQAVSGTLPAAERRDLVERMAADPALAAAWRVAEELQRAAAPGAPLARTSRTLPSWTLAGLAARTSAQHAGKTDRNTFLLATADSEDASLKLIADNNDIYQINWGAFFPASMIMMLRDAAVAFKGGPIKPTRLIFGQTIDTPAAAKSFKTITFNPLEPSYNYVYKKFFKYEDTPVKTAQVPPGQ